MKGGTKKVESEGLLFWIQWLEKAFGKVTAKGW
jgi:hypothetical protein